MSGLIGQTIDTYEVQGVLGNGGMGVVYRAVDTTLDRPVALKMMDSRFASDEMFLKRFQSEAKALAKLQHPGIVSIYALRETAQGFLIAMELVEGGTLADRLRQSGPMSPESCVRIFSQILTALDHAHEAGIVHRDIKPGNIMITADERVKVTDFGLAKIQQSSAMTMTMGTAGTLYYMSPEQVRGLANVDRRGDIYSLGITLYEALTGRVPFGDDVTDFAIRKAIVDGDLPPLEKAKPDLPRGLVAVVQRSIEKDPEKRYQTAAEMRTALEAHGSGVAAAPRVAAETVFVSDTPAAPSRRKFPLLPVAGLFLLVAVAALYFLWPSISGSGSGDADGAGAPSVAEKKSAGADPPPSIQSKQADSTEPGSNTQSDPSTIEKPSTATPGGTRPRQDPPPRNERRVETPPGGNTTGPAVTTERGRLAVAVFPSGRVTVDGITRNADAGQTAGFDLAAGSKTVTVTHPVYGTKRFSAAVDAGGTQNVSFYFEQTITVFVRPQFGNISVNGEDIGLYTTKMLTKGPGRYTINVAKEGKVVESVTLNGKTVSPGPQTITIEAGEQKRDYRIIFTMKDKI
ncbi:MAG: protein kinase [Ignavibacteriae bacterium]|nr:protein kinase [Ignavibacteriota bacterium]